MISNESKELDRILDALSNRRRRKIVHTLSLRPASIGQLADQQRSTLPAIHRHIKVLEKAKLVRRKKSGRVNFLAIDRTGLLFLQEWIGQYHAYWGTEAETLENYVADMSKREDTLTNKKK
jgi:DNA-binding transcriptional ArsR family regulator